MFKDLINKTNPNPLIKSRDYKNYLTCLFDQGKKNAKYIHHNPSAIWPYWIYRQCNWKNNAYIPSGNLSGLTNVTYRNWTSISYPGLNTSAIIDPSGMITPNINGWSINHALSINNSLVIPSHLNSISQRYDTKTLSLKTQFSTNDILTTITHTFNPNNQQSPFVFSNTRIKNITEKPISLSFLLLIQPINPEGVSEISSLTYLSQNAFMINNELGLILNQKPDNVICLSYLDGPIATSYGKWEMILQSTCEEKLCTGYAEYKLILNPNETRHITYIIPYIKQSYFKSSKKTPSKSHIALIQGFQNINETDNQSSVIEQWQGYKSKCQKVLFPNTQINQLIEQNQHHLISSITNTTVPKGSFLLKNEWIRELTSILSALNQIGIHPIVKSILNHHHTRQTISRLKSSYPNQNDILCQQICQFKKYIDYSQDIEFLEKNYQHMTALLSHLMNQQLTTNTKSETFGLLKPSTSFNIYGIKDYYLWDNFWLIAALSDASKLAALLSKQEDKSVYSIAHKRLLESTRTFIATLFEKRAENPFLPVSAKSIINSEIIYSLACVYPLNIINPADPLINETIAIIESNFLANGIFFNNIGMEGQHVALNCVLAQVYIKRQEFEKAEAIINWLIESANPSGSWPTTIHPITKGGATGDGHDNYASAEFLQLIHAMVCNTSQTTLELFPMIPSKWIHQAMQPIDIQNFPTPFGILNAKLSPTKDRNVYQLNLYPEFKHIPTQCSITFARTIKSIAIDKRPFHPINQNRADFSPRISEILIELDEPE